MKKDEVIKLISETQDNDCLIKGFSETDFISQLIVQAVDNHTDPDTGEVDLDELYEDLAYSKQQIDNAKSVVGNLANENN